MKVGLIKSMSTYEINEKVPVTKKYYIYNIEYRCKKCNEVVYDYKFESKKQLHKQKKECLRSAR